MPVPLLYLPDLHTIGSLASLWNAVIDLSDRKNRLVAVPEVL
jgi:hypothetical protein